MFVLPRQNLVVVPYFLTMGMIMATMLMMIGGHLSWTWVFPWGAIAFCWYSNIRLRKVRTPLPALLWVMVQTVTGLGSYALLWLPANF